MSVFFIGDLHLGHRNVLPLTKLVGGAWRGGETWEEHDEWVIEQCLSVGPTKRTLWYILGDVAMEADRLPMLDRLPGRKILVLGNHDLFPTQTYLEHFECVMGTHKKYGMWISHVPMHESELWGRINIHGHAHHNQIKDTRYLNCCVEWLPERRPISLEEVREHFGGAISGRD